MSRVISSPVPEKILYQLQVNKFTFKILINEELFKSGSIIHCLGKL